MADDVCTFCGMADGFHSNSNCPGDTPASTPEDVSNVVQMTPKQFVDTVNDLKNDGPTKDARWHRREARRLLNGKKGLTNEQKVERMERAKSHLEQSIALEIQGWE